MLYSSQGAIIERLVEVKKNINKALQIDSGLDPASKSLEEVSFTSRMMKPVGPEAG